MKKILFIESRTQTTQWDLISKKLQNIGYDIFWIVCSPVILPSTGKVFIVPYPSEQDMEETTKDYLLEVANSDRIIKYYGGNSKHYTYYDKYLSQLLLEINPDIVFGELANFHTHIICKLCKKRDILFFQPSTARYPNNRFRFFYDDNLLGYNYSNNRDTLSRSDEIIHQTMENILCFKKQPDYMNKISAKEKRALKYRALKFKMKLFYTRLLGDRYNIPSPRAVMQVKKQSNMVLKKWLESVKTLEELPKGKKILLFPLQMQPEFNLDVWGRLYNNQVKVIEKLSRNLPENWVVVVKLNPKSFLEMSLQLLDCLKLSNVIAISPDIAMNKLLEVTNAVFTITGTVTIECSVKKIPVFSPIKTDFVRFPYVHYLDDIEQIATIESYINTLEERDSNIIEYLYLNSAVGLVGEEITNPSCNSIENIDLLFRAFKEFLEDLQK